MAKTKNTNVHHGRPLVVVDWLDTCSPGRSWNAEDICEDYMPLACQSVGWMGKKNKGEVVLYSSHSFDAGSIGDVTAIPMGCIQKIRRLK